MPTREATIRINLDTGEFITKTKGLTSEADKAGSKIGGSLKDGFEKGGGALKKLFSSVTDLIGMGALVGGAFSFKAGIQGAMALDGQYRQVARTIRQISGDFTQQVDVQKTVTEAGKHTGESLGDLAQQYQELLRITGNVDFSKAALSSASQEATRTGKSFESLSSIAGALNEKFGITGKGIAEALRMITSNTDVGGPKLEDLAGGFDTLSATALSGGLKGAEGLKIMLGVLNETDNVLGGFMESNRALNGVFSALRAPEAFNKIKNLTAGTDSGFVKRLIDTPDAMARLNLILQKGGAVRKEFEKAITDRKEMALYKILTEPFDAAVKRSAAAGEKGAHVVEEGATAFTEAIAQMSRAGDTKAQAEAELAERMQSNKVKIDQALKELEEAFSQPEVIKAVKELIGIMPPLVHAFAELLKTVEGVADFLAKPFGSSYADKAAKELDAGVKSGQPVATANDIQDRLDNGSWKTKLLTWAIPGFDAKKMVPVQTPEHAATGKATEEVKRAAKATEEAKRTVSGTAPAAQAVATASRMFADWTPTPPPGLTPGLGTDGVPQARQTRAVEKSADVHEALTRNLVKASAALERLSNAAGGVSKGTTGDGTSKGPGGVSPVSPGWADKY